jgi:hypothetical protein
MSHLAKNGLNFYAPILVETMTRMAGKVGPGVNVIPFVPVPIGGIGSETLARDMMDLNSWIVSTGAGQATGLPDTGDTLWRVVLANENEAKIKASFRLCFDIVAITRYDNPRILAPICMASFPIFMVQNRKSAAQNHKSAEQNLKSAARNLKFAAPNQQIRVASTLLIGLGRDLGPPLLTIYISHFASFSLITRLLGDFLDANCSS